MKIPVLIGSNGISIENAKRDNNKRTCRLPRSLSKVRSMKVRFRLACAQHEEMYAEMLERVECLGYSSL